VTAPHLRRARSARGGGFRARNDQRGPGRHSLLRLVRSERSHRLGGDDRIHAALAQAGCTFADVVRVRYILPNRDDFEPCWPLFREAFADSRPAATMIECGLIDPQMLIEIEVTARRSG
jgi:hypothetical protein